jgi:hypothetical protein
MSLNRHSDPATHWHCIDRGYAVVVWCCCTPAESSPKARMTGVYKDMVPVVGLEPTLP